MSDSIKRTEAVAKFHALQNHISLVTMAIPVMSSHFHMLEQIRHDRRMREIENEFMRRDIERLERLNKL